ncbi:uncharacterized protein CEXT_88791 [Caerostris extrusa]|uniref:Uncharacterized protein n=1 Tax=Caerostris extrusa TaxID=172846 RepID=A0AAV4VDM8_CAEEX|nr:uncharacterized protein CEXT_88791 [Caerostris extrusa]
MNQQDKNLFKSFTSFNLLPVCCISQKKICFTVPEKISRANVTTTINNRFITEFLNYVKTEDVLQALKELQNMKKGYIRSLTFNDMTLFLDLLIRKKCLADLSSNVQAMSYVIQFVNEVFKPLLEKYSCSGDIDSIYEIATLLPDFALSKCNFNHYLTTAYIKSGKCEDLLYELEKHFNHVRIKLFTIPAFLEFLKRPDLEERTIKLANKYLEVNFDLPIAVVWAYYLTHENYEKANEFYLLYKIPVEKVATMVLKAIREQENVTMGKMYISILDDNSKNRLKERAYATVLEILISKEMYNDAIALITEAREKNIDVEKQYRSILVRLKIALEKEKKEVPFAI